ncbi:MAG: hypothetical protein PHP46_04255 [Candidatus Omnitrophica bacterium]|nr:hypothetical protein [Candidatus Omnitrophota bacterium]
MKSLLPLTILVIFSAVFAAGCGPTYPKEKLKESIIEVCKKDYNLDVKVDTVGKTIAIYLPLENLIDFTFAITKEASEKINDVILSVSRVALSTDAGYDFYCIIAHDIRIPEIQIVIIKSVDDVKRFLLNDISRGDYSKRMLIDIRFSPQAQKERAIKEVFSKMNVDKKWQEDVLNDFFRSEPAALGDIGYWNGRFYIKDISMPEFLAEQIASRTRFAFREDKELADIFLVKSAKGSYFSRPGKGYFKFEILAEQKALEEARHAKVRNKVFEVTLNEAAKVLHAYRFEDFDQLEIMDQSDSRSLDVSRGDLESYRIKELSLNDILKGVASIPRAL